MWRVLAAAGLIGLTAVSWASDAVAAPMVCGDRIEIVANFARTHKEVPTAIGLTDQGGLLEVLVGPTGSWTMLLTMPGGAACIIGTGQDWHMRPVPGADELA